MKSEIYNQLEELYFIERSKHLKRLKKLMKKHFDVTWDDNKLFMENLLWLKDYKKVCKVVYDEYRNLETRVKLISFIADITKYENYKSIMLKFSTLAKIERQIFPISLL